MNTISNPVVSTAKEGSTEFREGLAAAIESRSPVGAAAGSSNKPDASDPSQVQTA